MNKQTFQALRVGDRVRFRGVDHEIVEAEVFTELVGRAADGDPIHEALAYSITVETGNRMIVDDREVAELQGPFEAPGFDPSRLVDGERYIIDESGICTGDWDKASGMFVNVWYNDGEAVDWAGESRLLEDVDPADLVACRDEIQLILEGNLDGEPEPAPLFAEASVVVSFAPDVDEATRRELILSIEHELSEAIAYALPGLFAYDPGRKAILSVELTAGREKVEGYSLTKKLAEDLESIGPMIGYWTRVKESAKGPDLGEIARRKLEELRAEAEDLEARLIQLGMCSTCFRGKATISVDGGDLCDSCYHPDPDEDLEALERAYLGR